MKILIDHKNCRVTLWKNFIPDSLQLFHNIYSKTNWSQDNIFIFGKSIPIPRKQAWYGDQGINYHYSNFQLSPNMWFEELTDIKNRVDQQCQTKFNGALLNFYKTGAHYSAWHSDDEKELGKNPIIASISLGETRNFQLRHKKSGETTKIDLETGSLLLMEGATQHIYKHQLAKTAKIVGPRINITFRKIIL